MGYASISQSPEIHEPLSAGYEGLVREAQAGVRTLDLLIGGVHCAACIQTIEGLFAADRRIQKARLNFSTRKLHLEWAGSPLLANDYVERIEKAGYRPQPYNPAQERDETRAEEKFLLLCLGVAGFAMGNIMLLSVGLWTTDEQTMGMATRDFLHWISAIIAIPAIAFSGRPFFRSAINALSHGRTNMDVPISIGVTLATMMSLFEAVRHGTHVFFDSAVMLLFFLLIGRYMDFRARKQARSAATDLLASISDFADVIEGDKIRRIPTADLRPDMIVRVGMGMKFPADGIVIQGQGEVDTSLVTGESVPRAIGPGDQVYAGTVNTGVPMTLRVSCGPEATVLADIARLMEKAEQGQARYVRIADRAARLYTPVVHSFAAATFAGWMLIGGLAWQEALMIAVSVLIITCPCALGLAVPVVQVLASGKLLKAGILVKAGDALERLAVIDTILTDKTGTLTAGRPVFTDGPRDLLPLAAAMGTFSAHPLSRAITAAYQGERPPVETVTETPGSGVQGYIGGQSVRIGSRAWCGIGAERPRHGMELCLSIEGGRQGIFYFEDALRADAVQTVSALKEDGLDIRIISGDAEEPVRNAATQTGINDYKAGMTPPGKFALLEEMEARGRKILMVGDGLNDAPTLASAHVSMAPGTAIDMAQNAADIVFMGDNFMPVRTAWRIARAAQALVRQNLGIAVVYNLIAVPLAVCGFVTPFVAALAMSGSSVLVIANSFRLRYQA